MPLLRRQLYEACLEGMGLFSLLAGIDPDSRLQAARVILSSFVELQTLARIISELFSDPDPPLCFLWRGITMGCCYRSTLHSRPSRFLANGLRCVTGLQSL
jgi:prolipoprotein diacylglyceryltransferase